MKDKFAQSAYIAVTESVANTLTFAELNIAAETDKKKAMVIHRIEYLLSGTSIASLVATGDQITAGLSLSDSITTIGLNKIEVFDRFQVSWDVITTTGSWYGSAFPIDKRFNDMPGGGLIVPVKKLYSFIQGSSLAVATSMTARIWYTILTLSPLDYVELIEAMNILT